jgi:hypothetical protein
MIAVTHTPSQEVPSTGQSAGNVAPVMMATVLARGQAASNSRLHTPFSCQQVWLPANGLTVACKSLLGLLPARASLTFIYKISLAG